MVACENFSGSTYLCNRKMIGLQYCMQLQAMTSVPSPKGSQTLTSTCIGMYGSNSMLSLGGVLGLDCPTVVRVTSLAASIGGCFSW